MQLDLFFWWSVISTILGVIFICGNVAQFLLSKQSDERHKAQVKVWMQNANGVAQSLKRVVIDNLEKRYSSTNDMANAIWTIEANAFALYQALYEERCVTEEEYIKQQKELQEELKKNQKKLAAEQAKQISDAKK